MLDSLRASLLRLLAVPPQPHLPDGDTGQARVFRAAPNYFKYRLVLWGLGQLAALIGLAGATLGVYFATAAVDNRVFDITITLLEGAAWALFLLQLPVSLGILRLDFELRWYIVSDRALRIREGIISVREQTMTFANIQQVGIRQGPLQRLLGIADVHVTSAGGGGTHAESGESLGGNLHEAFFRGVDNAPEIREAIRRRAAAHRGAGLGDPEDQHTPGAGLGPALEAAGALLAEVRALRSVMPARD